MSEIIMDTRWLCAAVGAVGLALAGSAGADSPDVPLARGFADASLVWGPCPDIFPKGCRLAVLHGDPAKPNADVYLKVPAGAVLAHHWHTSAERMILAAGDLRVTYDGHPTAQLKPGMYAYGPAGLPHVAECKGSVPCVLFIAFEGPVDVQTGPPPGH